MPSDDERVPGPNVERRIRIMAAVEETKARHLAEIRRRLQEEITREDSPPRKK